MSSCIDDVLARGASEDPKARFNIAECLPRLARKSPRRVAIHEPLAGRSSRWRSIDCFELDLYSDRIAHALALRGLVSGDRVAVFVRPGIDFVAITFALFKQGAIPVLIDPGMGARAMVACLAKTKPRAFLGIPRAHALRLMHGRALDSIALAIVVGPARFLGFETLAQISERDHGVFELASTRASDQAAILFTSGSTGPPKGVVYTHAMFANQVRALRDLYDLRPGEVDLACFPLFALFDVALEMTSVFPVIDPSHPARCDPARIVAVDPTPRLHVRFGSPAIWRRVAPWCSAHGVRLPTLQRILIAGAPVEPALVESLHALLDAQADVYTPYGATECLPVSTISGREIAGALRARSESGAGICVGRAALGIELAIVAIDDAPIARWSDDLRLPPNTLGEICARGGVVTREYANEPGLTALAKIEDGASVWHRLGDVGYLDVAGLLWFCGRKSQRIETQCGLVMPVPFENIVNVHPWVRRTALVGLGARGSQRPALVVEPIAGAMPRGSNARARFARELIELARVRGRQDAPPRLPDIDTVLFKRSFPVDVRHNAKIRREALARWAEERAR